MFFGDLLPCIINFFRFFAAFRRRDNGARGGHAGIFPRKNTSMSTPDPPDRAALAAPCNIN